MASKITEAQEYDAYELAARLSPKELKELALMRTQLDTIEYFDEDDSRDDDVWEFELENLVNKWGGMINFPEMFIHQTYKSSGSIKFLNFVLGRTHGVSKIAYYSATEEAMTEMLYLSLSAKTKLIAYTLPTEHCKKLGIRRRSWTDDKAKTLLTLSKVTGFSTKFIVHEYFQFLKSYL